LPFREMSAAGQPLTRAKKSLPGRSLIRFTDPRQAKAQAPRARTQGWPWSKRSPPGAGCTRWADLHASEGFGMSRTPGKPSFREAIDVPVLKTGRLLLRPFRKDDLDDYAALNAEPEVMHHLGDGQTWDRGRSWRHLAFLIGHWDLGGCGTWAVELRETGAFLGRIGFSEPEGWPGCELAWALARRWWGFGYATEGARAALDHAFTVWRKPHVISVIHPENRASLGVAERLGERLEGPIDFLGRKMLCYGLDRQAYARRRRIARAVPATADVFWANGAVP